jgi:hypothetical protein
MLEKILPSDVPNKADLSFPANVGAHLRMLAGLQGIVLAARLVVSTSATAPPTRIAGIEIFAHLVYRHDEPFGISLAERVNSGRVAMTAAFISAFC